MKYNNPKRGEVLVAIMNNARDFSILKNEGWYRVPVQSAPKRWPPQWLAFYQTKVFKEEAYTVRYFGKVASIDVVERKALFPDEPPNPKSERKYYQVRLEKLEEREEPITTKRPRRLVFVPTTWDKFTHAQQMNDLFDDSPLEDQLWSALKGLNIPVERQWRLDVGGGKWYLLDFALFCRKGFVDIETDGDTWHTQNERIALDNKRNNDLAIRGWYVVRFTGSQIREHMSTYCIPKIKKAINKYKGLSDDGLVSRIFYPSSGEGEFQQLSLFDAGAEYNLE